VRLLGKVDDIVVEMHDGSDDKPSQVRNFANVPATQFLPNQFAAFLARDPQVRVHLHAPSKQLHRRRLLA
jgi:DNA-binding transcriptional LysR family regulator